MNILITGGAGFIGSHLCDALIAQGHSVRVLDVLVSQVHHGITRPPAYLHPDVDFHYGDVRDPTAVQHALEDIDAVYHFAAAVGVGQSMYEMVRYTSTNGVGTAVLLQALAQRRVQRLIVASSMSIYGEGVSGGVTRESWPANVTSVYGLSKYDQEQLCLIAGKAYGIPTTALRFFNVYGPRQALSNPYTGVIAIFASRLLNGKPPIIYEDGMQTRDFVSVHDVVNACALALVARAVGVFNVGTGRATTVLDVARMLRRVLGKLYIEPIVTGTRRAGDIRHCVADISQAREKLGYEPAIRLEDGLSDLADWLRDQVAVDNVERAARELELRGLTV